MNVKDVIKKNGYRLTKPRLEILRALLPYPFTVQEIYFRLKKRHITIDLVSVYRTLEILVDLGIVRVIDLGEDKKRYELVSDKKHHHHLVCNNCGSISDIVLDENKFLEDIVHQSKFKVQSHQLEFFGLCTFCQ